MSVRVLCCLEQHCSTPPLFQHMLIAAIEGHCCKDSVRLGVCKTYGVLADASLPPMPASVTRLADMQVS